MPVKGRRIDIKVARAGYNPDTVTLKPNEVVTLVFTRVEPTECGAQVSFPALGITKELPINTPVPIEYQAGKNGEVDFSCGMGMMHGALVIKD